MSRNIILNRNYKNPKISAALYEYSEDREDLLKKLSNMLHDEPLIIAMWLWGSFAEGMPDDLSDLDIWLCIPDEAKACIGSHLLNLLQTIDINIDADYNHFNDPADGGYIGARFESRRGVLQVDLYWQFQSTMHG